MTIFQVQLWNGSSWATTVEFNEKEVGFIHLVPACEIETMFPSDFKPRLYDNSRQSATTNERLIINIEIVHASKLTLPKVVQIIGAGYKIRVYYEYKVNAATYKDMIVSRQYKEIYKYGSEAAYIVTQLQFRGEV